MPAPVITFPGVEAVRQCRLVRSHGTSPNVISLTIAPQRGAVKQQGDLSIDYEGTRLVLKDCLVDATSFQLDPNNRLISLALFDRRWRWRNKIISGHYNRRLENGEIQDSGDPKWDNTPVNSKRTPRQLARLLLVALGETRFEERDIPNDVFPEVEWNTSNAAAELEQLCNLVRCRVVLGWNDQVRLARINEGAEIPDDLPFIRLSASVDVHDRPEKISVVTAPIIRQMDFELVAVGEDLDRTVKPIEELSFRPDLTAADGGWSDIFSPHQGFRFEAENTEHLDVLANKCIFKWFQIVVPFSFPETADGADSDITVNSPKEIALFDFLPRLILDRNRSDRLRFQDAFVYGRWYNEDKLSNVLADDDLNVLNPVVPLPDSLSAEDEDDPRQRLRFRWTVPAGFAIRQKDGIVMFGTPVYALNDETNLEEAPQLRLRASFQLRKPEGDWQRLIITRDQPEPHLNDERVYLRRDELIVFKRILYGQNSFIDNLQVETNKPAITDLANIYIDAAERQFRTAKPIVAEYAGFHVIDLDGAIQSVSFVFDSSGSQPVSTTVQREQDLAAFGNLSYEQSANEKRIMFIVNETNRLLLSREQMARFNRIVRS